MDDEMGKIEKSNARRKKFINVACIIIILIAIPLFLNFISRSIATKQVKIKVNIYSATNDTNKFIIIQKSQHRFLMDDSILYGYLEETTSGKKLQYYDVNYVSIKDNLKSDEQPYEIVTKEITSGVVSSEKIVLYLHNNYQVVVK